MKFNLLIVSMAVTLLTLAITSPAFAEAQHRFNPDTPIDVYLDVPYGDHERQAIDAYILKSDKPTPVLVHIHGGGWQGGDKSRFSQRLADCQAALDAGISVVAINYRFYKHAPFPAQMEDAARAIQLIRANAGKWNIDPTNIAAYGGSAGGHLAAFLAYHDDMADPDSDDPIARQSTRLTCAVPRIAPSRQRSRERPARPPPPYRPTTRVCATPRCPPPPPGMTAPLRKRTAAGIPRGVSRWGRGSTGRP